MIFFINNYGKKTLGVPLNLSKKKASSYLFQSVSFYKL